MALTKQYWTLNVSMVDRGGKKTRRKYRLVPTDTAWDASAVNTAVGTIITDLNAVTECVITGYTMGVEYLETSLTLPTSAEAELEQHLLISAQIKGLPNKSAVIDIPAPAQTLFLSTSGEGADELDPNDADYLAFVKLFDSAQTNLIKVSDGEFIDYLTAKGRKTHSHSKFG